MLKITFHHWQPNINFKWAPRVHGVASEIHLGCEGKILQTKFRSTYVTQEMHQVDLFMWDTLENGTSSRSLAFIRHPLNDRDQGDTRARYKKMCLKKGILDGVRIWDIF